MGAALAGLFLVLIVLVTPGTAYAHGADGVDDSDFRVSVNAVPAELTGVEIRPVEAASRLELYNGGPLSVEVLGYDGEPYLQVRPDGVYVNVFSPAAYLNETASGSTAPPDYASPAQAPYWQKATDEPRVRWFDHRAHWMNEAPPTQVVSDPVDQKIFDWAIPLRVGVTNYTVTGTLEWLAPPSAGTWGAFTLLAGVAVAAVAIAAQIPAAVSRWILAGAAGIAGSAALADAVGRAVTSQDLEVSWLTLLVTSELWPLIGALVGLGAAVYAAMRKPAADLALGVAGVCIALFSGFSRVTSFGFAVTPTPWSGDLARAMVVATLGLGAGLAVGALVRARRTGQAH
ncbi:hypothetical protein AB0I28_31630 [Phytomonospora sp. NPDC050363]|uniref:hypothetical protein n=1 Tax=Phytomonospora sp. NPDC050363 TaxID=3155642 RepID=UPI0033CC6680